MRGVLLRKAAVVAALGTLAALPLRAAGFSIFEQGSKAMGMAGAFTAQADDPSALFHNAGGIAFFDHTEFAAGATWIHSTEADFQGANPFPGTGARGEQEALSEFPPHLYWVQPINPTLAFGLGVETPFGLTTEWQNPESFAGRFISTKAALRAIDVNPTIGWRSGNFGIGVGAIARFSDVELQRRLPQNNPFTQRIADVARVTLSSDFNEGYGWNVGILHKVNPSFSWGLSYRSKITVDYEGDARFTQILTGIPQFDLAVSRAIPFDQDVPLTTSIEFPDEASLGLAFGITPNLLVETDFNWTGWSSFDELTIDFTDRNQFDSTIPQQWEDANNYRIGLRWTVSPASQLRFGYVFDETPQPEEAVSPLLPDADRNGFTIGYGWTGGLKLDLAVMYLPFEERTRERSFIINGRPENPFLGTYNTTAWLFGTTVRF
jgi:long-chain fatty acid transport protein